VKIIDLTTVSMNWNNPFQTRNTNQIRRISIHHSATKIGSQVIFENHWRNLGWRNGGYHEIVLLNSDVEICYDPTIVVNGVGDHNIDTYHICVVGNFRTNGVQPTKEQLNSLIQRIRFNMSRFKIPVDSVLGHNEFSNTVRFNHRSNTCPGQDMNVLRELLQLPLVAQPPVQCGIHVVRAGDNLFQIARKNNTTVALLQQLNNLQNVNLIRIGQTLNLPDVSSNPNQTQITVGTHVRVNQTARNWVTGEIIPNWVRGQTYEVMQIRQNNNELLLRNILSWIHIFDVTPI